MIRPPNTHLVDGICVQMLLLDPPDPVSVVAENFFVSPHLKPSPDQDGISHSICRPSHRKWGID